MIEQVVYGDVTVSDIILASIILFSGAIFARSVVVFLKRTLSERMKKDQLELFLKVVYYSIIFTVFVAVLPILGLNLSGLLVAGGITGIVIGFASQSVISNFISGLFLIWEKPIKIGDSISVGNVMGVVTDIRVMSTTIRTFDGLFVRIPNSTLFTSNITNLTTNVARRFEYIVGIGYKDDADKAKKIIENILEDHPFVLKNPPPTIFVDNLGESRVDMVVRIWAPSTEWFNVKMELLWKIKCELEKNGIQVPFPQRVLWFANELSVSGGYDRKD
ncbi:MAG: mechanosensitive ion channel family protein [Archaeoglobales archaeon]|nr:mechanosensitive ion channel family protein [Archaeoglobales archaeon]